MSIQLPPTEIARSLLDGIDASFSAAVGVIAMRCRKDGRLDPALLDENQWASYELAHCAADLRAARTVLESCEEGGPLERALALAFNVDAIAAVAARLQGIYATAGMHCGDLNALVCGDALRKLREQAASSGALSRLGEDVAAAHGEVAEVHLDEHAAMAFETFKRFAAEVVEPLAEKIHREDLTVPEALLGPMREMGVFRLSIPERYGGNAPDGQSNTATMMAVTEALSEASLAAAGSLITRPEILARALLAGGTEAQKCYWLPKLASGELLCAISITEPDYGSDVARLALRGTRVPGGWVLNGAKTWCTFAGKAAVLMVVVRTDQRRSAGHRGLSLMLVENPSMMDVSSRICRRAAEG